MDYLVVAQAGGDGVSADFALKLVGGIFAGLATLITAVWAAYKKGQSNPTTETTLKAPVPTLEVREVQDPATRGELRALDADFRDLKDDIEKSLDEIKAALERERGIARTANGNLHKRIDDMRDQLGDRLSHLEGTTKGVAETVGRLLELALGKKPTTGR